MNLLLDTHIFLWYISKDARLSQAIEHVLQLPENRVFLSPVSLWECHVKYRLGKLPLPQPPEEYLPLQRHRHAIETCRWMKPAFATWQYCQTCTAILSTVF